MYRSFEAAVLAKAQCMLITVNTTNSLSEFVMFVFLFVEENKAVLSVHFKNGMFIF